MNLPNLVQTLWSKKLTILIIGLILITSVGWSIYFLRPTSQTAREKSLSEGLAPIRIMQVVDGEERELNTTEATLDILEQSLQSRQSFEAETVQALDALKIERIIFPPLPEKYIQRKPASDNPQQDIEIYLKEVYSVFKDNNIQPNINQLTEEALSQNTTNIQNQIQINSNLYYALFGIKVPKQALPLHKKYIQLVQIQNNFLLGLLKTDTDPLHAEINTKITFRLLDQVNNPIKQELQKLREKYNIRYQR